MTEEKRIEVAIQKLAGTYLKDIIQIFACKVESVDVSERTCECTPIGSDSKTKLPGVLLCAENDNGLVVTPSIGSTVIVALSTRNTAFILMYSSIDKVQFMDGSLGGMVIIDDLITQYEAKLTAIKAAISASFAIIDTQLMALGEPGGSATAFDTAAAAITGLDKTTLENKLITQGKIS